MAERINLKLAAVLASLKPNERVDIRYDRALEAHVCFVVFDTPLPGMSENAIEFKLSNDKKHVYFDFFPSSLASMGRANAVIREWVREHGLVHGIEAPQARIYLGAGPDNSASISAYPFDDPEYESYHWDVLDHHAPSKLTQDALIGCLRNVLARTGANIIME